MPKIVPIKIEHIPENTSSGRQQYNIYATTIPSAATAIFKIFQRGKTVVENYFYWLSSNASAVTTTVQSAATATTAISYRTNYSDLTTASTDTWITGATLNDGVFKASFSANSDTVDRTGTVNIMHGSDIVGKIEITQRAKKPETKYFWTNESGKTRYETGELMANKTSIHVPYLTNYTHEEIQQLMSAVTFPSTWITELKINEETGKIDVTFEPNTSSSIKTGYVHIRKNNNITTVSTIKIELRPGDKFFSWIKGNIEATAATADTINKEGGNSSKPYYLSGYTRITASKHVDTPSDVLKNNWLNISLDNNNKLIKYTAQTNTSADTRTCVVDMKYGSSVIGKLTVNQSAGDAKYFKLNGSEEYPIIISATVEATYDEIDVSTNYSRSDINFEFGGFLNSVVLSDDLSKVTFSFSENTGAERTAKIVFYTGSTTANTIGSISITQEGVAAKEFYWISGDTSATTLNVTTEATVSSITIDYYSTYEPLSLSSDYYGRVVTEFNPSALTEDNDSLDIDFVENISTTVNQTDIIYAKDENNNVVGKINLTQLPKGSTNYWFKWVKNNQEIYNIPGYISKEGDMISYEYQTNIDGLTFSCEHLDWFSGFTESGTVIEGKNYFEAELLPNMDETIHDITVLVLNSNEEVVGKLTFKQEATLPEKYIWINTIGNSGVTYDTSHLATSVTYTIFTNYTLSEFGDLQVVKDITATWITNLNFSKTQLSFNITKNEDKYSGRTCDIIVKNINDEVLLTVNVNQDANDERDFKWIDGIITAQTATTVTSESSITESVNVRYQTDYDNLNVSLEGTPDWIKNLSLNTSENKVTYDLDDMPDDKYDSRKGVINLYSNSKLIGIINVVQNPAPEPDKFFKFIYGGEEYEGDLPIENVPATRAPQYTINVSTNYPLSSLSLQIDGTFGSGWIKNLTADTAFTITFNVDDNTSTERTGYIYVKLRTTILRTITITQIGRIYTFSWNPSGAEVLTAKTTDNISVTGTTGITIRYYSDYPNITLTDGSPSVIGITCTIDTGNCEVTYTATARGPVDYTEKEKQYLLYSNNSKLIGILIIKQDAQVSPLDFKWTNHNNESSFTNVINYNSRDITEPYTLEPSTGYNLAIFSAGTVGMLSRMELNSTAMTCHVTEYTDQTTENREVTISVRGETGETQPTVDSPVYATYIIQQIPTIFEWLTGSVTAKTATTIDNIVTARTSITAEYKNNYSNVQVITTGIPEWITSPRVESATEGGSFKCDISQNDTVKPRNHTFSICGQTETLGSQKVIGTIKLQQIQAQGRFTWDANREPDYTGAILTSGGSWNTAYGYNTNYSSLTATIRSGGEVVTGDKFRFQNSAFQLYTTPNTGQTERTCEFIIIEQDVNNSTIGSIKFTQAAPPEYFKWSNGLTAITVNNIAADAASIPNQTYDTTYTGLTLVVKEGTNILSNTSFTATNSTFTANIQTNTGIDERTCIYTVKGKWRGVEKEIGEITITQKAADAWLKWTANNQTAYTINNISASIYNLSESFTTNVPSNRISTVFTITNDREIQGITWGTNYSSVNGSIPANTSTASTATTHVYVKSGQTTIAVITIIQDAAEPYFRWKTGGNVDTISLDMLSASTTSLGSSQDIPFTAIFETNCSPLGTVVAPTGYITGITTASTQITGKTRENTDINSREAVITIKNGTRTTSPTIAYLTVKQTGATPYFKWSDNTTAITVTIGSGATSVSQNCSTNIPIPNLGVVRDTSSTSSFVTSPSITTTTTTTRFTGTTTANSTINERSETFNVYSGGSSSNVVGKITVKQEAKAYFEWSDGVITDNTATTVTIPATATSVTVRFNTNYSGLHTGGTSTTWLTNRSISVSDLKFTATTSPNTSATARTASTISIRSGATGSYEVGTLKIIQAAVEPTERTVTLNTGTWKIHNDNQASLTGFTISCTLTATTGTGTLTASTGNITVNSVNDLSFNGQIQFTGVTTAATTIRVTFKFEQVNNTGPNCKLHCDYSSYFTNKDVYITNHSGTDYFDIQIEQGTSNIQKSLSQVDWQLLPQS